MRAIAREMGRDPSTISRELRRNAATRSGKLEYRATVAQWKAQMAAKRPNPAKLATNDRLNDYVRERLSGELKRPRRHRRARPANDLERLEQAAPSRPPLVHRMESRADFTTPHR